MSNEERNHEPESNEQENNPEEASEPVEPVEEAQGSPGDPESLDENTASEVSEGDEAAAQHIVEEEPGVAEEELALMVEELEATRRERDEYLERLQRLKAEFENSRKRQERELAKVRDTASEKLVIELLPVLDNLDRALEHEGDIRNGVRATRDSFSEALAKEGLVAVASDGQHFDPNVHEAVMSQPSEDHEEGTILQTFERGYLLNGKAIRPAKVVVAQ